MYRCDICGLKFKTARGLAIHRRLVKHSLALFEVARQIGSAQETKEILNVIVKSIACAIKAKGCSLVLLSSDRKQLLHSVAYGLSDWYLEKGPIAVNKSLSQVLKGKPVQAFDATKDKNVQYRWHNKKEGIASILAVPVILDNEVIGMMRVYTTKQRSFAEEEINFVEAAASLGALALQKAKLHEEISKDLEQRSSDLSKLQNERESLFRFMSRTAHDLKAPLSAVQTYFGVLLGGFAGNLDTKQREIIEKSSNRIVELLELISDLLDIARIESGQIITEMEQVSLKSIIESPLETGHTLAKKKGIELEIDIPDMSLCIYCAVNRLRQVLTEVISNAVKYTDGGGSVKVKVIDSQDSVQFEVSDTGIGIPKSEVSQVFDEFFRGSNAKTQGSGLGLSIAKGVIEASGGRIWAESPCLETRKGCKIAFTVPKIGGEVEECLL